MSRGNQADEDAGRFNALFPGDRITPKQLEYIKSLSIKLGVPIDSNLHSISKSEASTIISKLKSEEELDRDFQDDGDEPDEDF